MIDLTVNGVRHEQVEAEPSMPLLWVLRDRLHLTGSKFGCGMGLCGACTVHLDGVAVRACQLPVSAAVGHQITTIEGLSPSNSHPLQLAWVAEDVPQCGYCQSGQLMSATELLTANVDKMPSEYFREHIYMTFQDDFIAFRNADQMNWRRLCWANDFPHSDSTWPWSQDVLKEQTGHLTPELRKRILRDNVVELYKLAA